jgi:hypothetical protein
MKLQSWQELLLQYGITELEPDDAISRNALLLKRPWSVILEGDFMELDSLNKWIEISLAPSSAEWLFYGKTSYNYGFAEYFFSNEPDAQAVRNAVPNIYTIYPHSNSPGLIVKTNGYGGEVVYNPGDEAAIVLFTTP